MSSLAKKKPLSNVAVEALDDRGGQLDSGEGNRPVPEALADNIQRCYSSGNPKPMALRYLIWKARGAGQHNPGTVGGGGAAPGAVTVTVTVTGNRGGNQHERVQMGKGLSYTTPGTHRAQAER